MKFNQILLQTFLYIKIDIFILLQYYILILFIFSVNHINTLADFQYCLSLQELFVRNNNIEDLNEVCYLQGLPNLRNLWLGENPCAEKEGYIQYH